MKNLYTLLFVLIICVKMFPQNSEEANYSSHKKTVMPEIMRPSPNVSALVKIEEVPVDTYTGAPSIDIPLYSKSIFGLNYKLGLAYNPSGLRVDEVSSWVGTGWALNEGAVITRSVVGLPDEKLHYGVLHNGYLDFDNLSTYERSKLVWQSRYGDSANKEDVNLDIYQFNILGEAGRFVIIKNATGNLEAKMIGNDSKIRIEIIHDSTYKISKFTVTTTQGLRYTLDYIESIDQASNFSLQTQFGNFKQNTIESTEFNSYRSAWKASKIETVNGIKICEFFYSSYMYTNSTPLNITRNTIHSLNFDLSEFMIDGGSQNFNASVLKPRRIESWNTMTIYSPKIERIEFFDNSSIVFSTSNHSESGFKLDRFEVLDQSNLVTAFSFNYEENNSTAHRLFLMDVKQHSKVVGNNQTMDYVFDYDDKEALKGFNSPQRDLFGYYNGNDFDNSNKTHIKKGVLKEITYPTGGKKEFDFEANTFGFISGRQLTLSELFENTDNRIDLNVAKTYTASVEDPFYNSSVNNKHIVYIYADQKVEMITSINNGNPFYLSQCQVLLKPKQLLPGVVFNPQSTMNPQLYISDFTDDQNRIGAGFYINSVNQEAQMLDLKEGFYFMEFHIQNQFVDPNLPNHNNGNMSVNLLLKHAKLKPNNLSKFLYGGGLRIKEVRFTDSNDIKQTTTYNYDLVEQDPFDLIQGNLSSGSIDLLSLKTNYELLINELFCTPYQSSKEIEYTVENVNNPLNAQLTKGSYVGYKNVTVKQVDQAQTNGKTIYTYTSPMDHSQYPELYSYPFPPVPDTDYKRGNLITTEFFDSNNQKIKKVTNEYSFFNQNVLDYWFFADQNIQTCAYDRFFASYQEALNNIPSTAGGCFSTLSTISHCDLVNIFSQPSSFTKGKAFLSSSTTEDYFYTGGTPSITSSKKEYEYNLENYQVNVEKYSFKEKNEDVIIETINSYPVGSIGNSAPLLSGESSALSKLVSLNKINEISHVVRFKNNLPVSSKALTYFEFSQDMVGIKRHLTSKNDPTNNTGGLNGFNENFSTDFSFTAYDVYGNPLELQQENGTLISYIWGYNHTQPVAKIENIAYNSIPTNLITAIHSATNESAMFSALTALRNHSALANAMVSTFTYIPLVGIKTMTDPKGYTMTYHYDAFNRLEKITDMEGNILSENEYHYRTQN